MPSRPELPPVDPGGLDLDRPALGVRQPWADLIVRGLKTVELRTVGAQVRGPIYIYASRTLSRHPSAIAAARHAELDLETLPRGVVVGSVELWETEPATAAHAADACVEPEHAVGLVAWRLRSAEPFPEPVAVQFQPYGVWFYPWRRRHASRRRGS